MSWLLRKEILNMDKTIPDVYKISDILSDGSLVEMFYKPESNTTGFVVSNGQSANLEEVKFVELINTEQDKILPWPPTDQMLKSGFLKLPNGIEGYGDNHRLFAAIKMHLKKWIFLPEEFYTIAAIYIMMTWVYDKFPVVPYLRVIGGFGSGKTRFLEVVGSLCYKAMFFGGPASNSAIFRTLNQIKGTMVFDETDFKNSDMWSIIVKILNAGHIKNFPVLRMEPKKDGTFKTVVFDVFGPKILASRERFGDQALESRCITQWLYHGKANGFPITMSKDNEDIAAFLRRMLLAFRFSNYGKVEITEQYTDKIKTPRVKQTFSAMLTVAALIGEDVVNKVLEFGIKADNELKSQLHNSFETEVLICLQEMLAKDKNQAYVKKIRIKEVADWYSRKFYNEYNDRPDSHYKSEETGQMLVSQNYVVSAKRIGTIISKLGIKKFRDSTGFSVPASEYKRIHDLAEYYGITKTMLGTEKEEMEDQTPLLP